MPEHEKTEHAHHESHAEHHVTHHKKSNPVWMIFTVILAVLLVVSIFTKGFTGGSSNGSVGTSETNINVQNQNSFFGGLFGGNTEPRTEVISKEQAQTKALDLINNVLLQGQATATVKSMTEVNGLYNMTLDIDGKSFSSYISKDGKLLFPTGIDIEAVANAPAQPAPTPQNIPKTDKPKMQLFVMAFCPYGIQAEKGLKPVVDLLKDKATFELNFIGNVYTQAELDAMSAQQKSYYQSSCAKKSDGDYYCSLHGDTETMEDIHQLCIMKYAPTKLWDYIGCIDQNPQGDWKSCATQNSITVSNIESCSGGTEGLNLFKENIKIADAAGATGSPTIIINGASYSGGRTSEAFKQGVCGAFNTAPTECGTALSGTAAATTGSCG